MGLAVGFGEEGDVLGSVGCSAGSAQADFEARLLDAVGQAIVATDAQGVITYWNRAAEQLFGWSEAEMVGSSIFGGLLREFPKKDRQEILERLSPEKPWVVESTLKRRNGSVVPVIVSVSPVFGVGDELWGVVGVCTDISEQKWMLEVLEDAIRQVAELNEKLQVVESLTRHDVRNKLAALNGRVYLLRKMVAGEALAQVEEIDSISGLMQRILEFERLYVQVGSEELKHVDVGLLVDEAAALFSGLRGVRLVNECGGLVVLADSLLRQLFYNLMDNSLKYGEKLSGIRVFFRVEKDCLRLIYEDNGVGVSEELRSGLFREGVGRGTGYGLYLIKRICGAYGWSIAETGKQGAGAQFTMTIPKGEKEGKATWRITGQNA